MSASALSSVGGIQQIMSLREQIIGRSDLLKSVHQNQAASQTGTASQVSGSNPGAFADTLKDALHGVNAVQTRADDLSAAYDRGDVTDVAKVMLARQEAGVAFEATLQVRNKLLSAYQDIMRMGV